MFGRGTIATIYGWALSQAGHDVEFYVRPGRAAEYGDTIQFDLLDARGRRAGERVVGEFSIRLREEFGPDDGFDLVVVSVAHHRLTAAAEFIAPRIGEATVLVFGNVWAEPSTAVGPIPADQIVWGFPLAGGGFDDAGVLRGALLRRVVFGTLRTAPSARGLATREAFRRARLIIQEQQDIRGWLWIHFIADAGMHAQGVRLGSLSRLIGNRRGLREALLTSRELLPVVEARGVDLRRHRASTSPFRVPAWLVAPAIALATSRVRLARASLEMHTDPNATEPAAVCRDALLEARRLDVAVPRLDVAM